MSLANKSLFDGESLVRRCSEDEQASINVWAITDNEASTVGVLLTSKTKSGFLMKFTQNLRGKLFDFQACSTSGSNILCFLAPSSSKSNNHLIAGGKSLSTVNIIRKKSVTNFSIVPLVDNNLKETKIVNHTENDDTKQEEKKNYTETTALEKHAYARLGTYTGVGVWIPK